MTAFRDSARIFRIADIIGYIEVFCNFNVEDCDLMQLQQHVLLHYYLWAVVVSNEVQLLRYCT